MAQTKRNLLVVPRDLVMPQGRPAKPSGCPNRYMQRNSGYRVMICKGAKTVTCHVILSYRNFEFNGCQNPYIPWNSGFASLATISDPDQAAVLRFHFEFGQIPTLKKNEAATHSFPPEGGNFNLIALTPQIPKPNVVRYPVKVSI